jgi:predicted aldo/keto reductase-like oxidoreductase
MGDTLGGRMSPRLNRREFLKSSAAALSIGFASGAAPHGAVRTATDQVALGKSGIRLSRLGIGTGSSNGQVQRDLGQEGFTRLVHAAFERGVTYIDTAHNYQTHGMVRQAIKGLPRERLFIQSKLPWERPEFADHATDHIDRFRRELGTDYIDSLLIHCTTTPTWTTDLRPMQDAFDEAKARGHIRAKGVSCHGLPALRAAATHDWVDVHLARINAQGRHMDGATGQWSEPGDRESAMREIQTMHARGHGVIGMKLVGNGDFRDPADREKAMRFVLTCGCVDAVVVGVASVEQLDETIARMNRILAEA